MICIRATSHAVLAIGLLALTACSGGSGSTPPMDASTTCQTAGTLTVTNSGMSAYVIDQVENPTLTFCRGSTYVFSVNAPGHPFYIKTVMSTGTANTFDTGVTGNGADVGDVTFAVPSTAPDPLFYNCSLHAAMSGAIRIID